MSRELDLAVLTRDLPEKGLKAGDVGTVVLEHAEGRGLEAEFMTLADETVAVVTLSADSVHPVARDEIAHARHVA